MEKEPLQTTFDYLHRAVHTEDGWITPLRDAVKDVTAEEARWKPSSEVSSIWEVTAHATPYLYDVLRALRGEEKMEHQDWHSISDESEGAWVRLRNELLSGIEQFGEEIAEIQEADFLAAPLGRKTAPWETITDIAVHDAYHAGQIVKLRQLYAARSAPARESATV